MPAVIGGGEPGACDLGDLPGAEQPPAQTQDVRVVVPPGEPRAVHVADHRGPHAGQLVGGDAHADAGAADQNAEIRPALGHRGGHLRGIPGIAGGLVPAAAVHIRKPQLLQHLENGLLGLKARVIAADIDGPAFRRAVCTKRRCFQGERPPISCAAPWRR